MEEAAAVGEAGPAFVERGGAERAGTSAEGAGTSAEGAGTSAEGASGHEGRAPQGPAHGAFQGVGPWDASPWEQAPLAPLDVACQEEASYQMEASYLQREGDGGRGREEGRKTRKR